ncbi:MAG TPA: hypothetical protein VFO70_00400 [Chitinophagaceae bacterium]|nr:hypothetical protein [Chitinophagaceae bacterium]
MRVGVKSDIDGHYYDIYLLQGGKAGIFLAKAIKFLIIELRKLIAIGIKIREIVQGYAASLELP